jgi:adenosylcobinamide amidohydrolase
MNEVMDKNKETKLNLQFKEADARVIYREYEKTLLNLTLVSFKEKRRVLSTLDGFRNVHHVGNVYVPGELSTQHMTLQTYGKFERGLPRTLGIPRRDMTFLSTGVDMEKVAFCEKTYGDFHVCIIATGGARNNALRMGVDVGNWVENKTEMKPTAGTINMLLLTNVYLSWGAMARAIMTATEAKTAALQDLKYMSTPSPQIQATGTGTDSMIVVSGVNSKLKIKHTGGHSKMGELIGVAAKTAVAEALIKHDN